MKPILPRYRLIDPAFLQPSRSSGPSKFEAGATIDFEGVPTFAMTPINDQARAAKAAAIRAYGVTRLRNPPPGDRSALITITRSIGGRLGTVDEMASQVEQWLAKFPPPQQDATP